MAQRLTALLATQPKQEKLPQPLPKTKWDAMDNGPFFSSSFGGSRNPVMKGISIRLGGTNGAGVCFDAELLRMRMGWTGGFLRLPRSRDGLEGEPMPAGTAVFQTMRRPGWSIDGAFTDLRPRFRDAAYGGLPKTVGHFCGIFTHGHRTILSYTVGSSKVLESPSFAETNRMAVFTRNFEIAPTTNELTLQLCADTNAIARFVGGLPVLTVDLPTNKTFTFAKVVGAPKGFTWKFDAETGVQLKLPAFTQTAVFSVYICSGGTSNLAQAIALLPDTVEIGSLSDLCHGGPLLWTAPIVTNTKLGTEDNAYQVDHLTLPEINPWASWVRPSGFDFFSNGRIALCSLSGDVWIASGVDAKYEQTKWKRFATGLFQPLGLKIVKDEVYVMCRDALVHLRDLNGDGEADSYEWFNSDISSGNHFHEFCLDLQTDSHGNFLTFKGSNLGVSTTPHQGTLLKISPDGSQLTVVATGFRAPNGLAVSPTDGIFGTDNEGEWMPACKLNHIEESKFYGFADASHIEPPPTKFEPPVCWVPQFVDNSSGAPIWVTSTNWGPFGGQLLLSSYGKCSLFAVMMEKVNGKLQGGVVKFPLKFDTGIMRGRFNPADGQLYLCGLSGWQTSAVKDGGLYRVRFNERPVNMPCALHVHRGEIEVRFTDPIKTSTATDTQNFAIEQWNYKWSSGYGSEDFSVNSPNARGRETLPIESASVSVDHRSVFLKVPGLQPVMQMKIAYNIDAANGSHLQQEIYNTIHGIPTDEALNK